MICRPRLYAGRRWKAALLAASLAVSPAMAQQPASSGPPQTMVNLRDADIRAFINDVAKATGTSFVIDSRVQGKVSVLSDRPLSRQAYFELFLATLRANGFVAVPMGGGQYRIQPAEAGAGAAAPGDATRFATAVIPVSSMDAQAAADSLRPILSRHGSVAANRSGRAVVITDFADNIARARTALREMDQDRSSAQIVSLDHAGARDLAGALQSLARQGGGAEGGRPAAVVVAIDGSNAVAIKGDASEVSRLAGLARDLDQQAASGSDVRVLFLQHADAAAILPVLQQLMGQAASSSGSGALTAGLAGTPFAASGGRQGGAQAEQGEAAQPAATAANLGVASGPATGRRAVIARYEGANAIIISASPQIQRELGEVVRQLDTRRPQVHVEAIIVEISDTAAQRLGVQFLLAGRGGAVPLASTNFANASPNLMAISGAIAAEKGVIPEGQAADSFREAAVASMLGTTGGTAGIGRIGSDLIFGAVVNAVRSDGDSNILSAPTILTLDNHPARILVGQEIPVTTGEALGDNLENSFRTVQRQDVGIQLAVKPQINAGGSVTLGIKQVVSSIAQTVADRDFVLNKRELETAVTVSDGQVIALGGLLDDTDIRSLQKVPFLGDIPVLGQLFRSRNFERRKTNLMIFIRPTIVRDQASADAITATRWDHVREQQIARDGFSSLDGLAHEYLRTPPPYKPAPYPPAD